MAFKLGSQTREFKNSDNVRKFKSVGTEKYGSTPILRTSLEGDTLAEANMDGTISIDSALDLNSKFGKRVLRHEQQHLDDIESGRAAYNDSAVMWEDKFYFRREINGEKVVDGPNGRWPEGDKNHPWEQSAIQAENTKK